MFFRRKTTEGPAGDLKLVVGLGNIGKAYEHTRHNVGFDVVDELARLHSARFRRGKFNGEEAEIRVDGQRVLLLKPHTLMNLSGNAVAPAVRFYRLPLIQLLVVTDDFYLPVGKLRFRPQGSDGGHNGLFSLINRLGSQEFPRLRIGVGEAPADVDKAHYVLSQFPPWDKPVIREAVETAARAVETWVKDGMGPAMNRWNAWEPTT
ncbi:MAG: aminoacyl-tRNA hydrolase [Armatimonadota bacterium]